MSEFSQVKLTRRLWRPLKSRKKISDVRITRAQPTDKITRQSRVAFWPMRETPPYKLPRKKSICYTFSLVHRIETCNTVLVMSKYPKSPIETSAGDRLRAAFDRQHYTMPFDALEASEIAEHILEAIDAWSTAGFGAITADEIREAIKLRVTSGSTRISAMTLGQLRGEVLERMRSIAQEIGSESCRERV